MLRVVTDGDILKILFRSVLFILSCQHEKVERVAEYPLLPLEIRVGKFLANLIR